MNEGEECYLEFPQPKDPPLFESNPSSYSCTSLQGSMKEEEPICQLLLSKISMIHESLRNKKALQFQLMQAETMKKYNRLQCSLLEQSLQDMSVLQLNLIKNSRQDKQTIKALQKSIEQMNSQKQQQYQRIAKIEQQIASNSHKLSEIQRETKKRIVKQDKQLQQHSFISIEKIKLQGQNQSKNNYITSIKTIVQQTKQKIAQKTTQKAQLQQEHHKLIQLIQNEDKLMRKTAQPPPDYPQQIAITYRSNNHLHNSAQSIFGKESDINLTNKVTSKNSSVTLKINTLVKKHPKRANSEAVSRKKDGKKHNSKNRVVTLKSHLKRVY